jgi:hypothetical protein
MSSAHVDISYDLVDGIFTVLDGNVSYGGTVYPVYKSVPKPPAETYVFIHNVISAENGTKDEFLYEGTVQIDVVDEISLVADKKKAQGIIGVVRGLLKPSKDSVFSIGDTLTLVIFSPASYNEMIDISGKSKSVVQLSERYEFLIQ